MSFSWKTYVELADKLLRQHKQDKQLSDACLRATLSKSYYGVFGLAKDYLNSIQVPVSTDKVHERLRDALVKSGTKECKEIATNLSRLCVERKKADYEKNATITEKDAKLQLKMAMNTVIKLEKLIKSISQSP